MNCTKFCGRIAGADLADLVLFLSFFLSFIRRDLDSTLTFSFFCVRTSRPITTTIAAARSFFLFFSIRQLCCEGSRCASKVAISTFFCLFVFLFYLEWSGSSGSTPPFGTATFGFFLIWRKNKRVQGPSTGFRFHFFSFDLFLFVS